MINKKNFLEALSCTALALMFTSLVMFVAFGSWEIYSDNIIYKVAFERMAESVITDAYIQFVSLTAGAEPVTFLIFWIFSQVTTYFNFIFILNLLLCVSAIKFLRRSNISFFYVIIALFSNYYIIVMMIGIQRFKIAFIFLLLIFVLDRYKKTFSLLAIGSHFQSLIALPAFSLVRMRVEIKPLFKFMLFGATALVAIHALNPDIIQKKLIGRIDLNWQDLIKSTLLSAITLSFIKKITYGKVVSLTLLCFAALILGGFRVNMLLYFLSMYMVLDQEGNVSRKKTFVVLSSMYLFYKSVELYYGHYSNNLFIDGDINSVNY